MLRTFAAMAVRKWTLKKRIRPQAAICARTIVARAKSESTSIMASHFGRCCTMRGRKSKKRDGGPVPVSKCRLLHWPSSLCTRTASAEYLRFWKSSWQCVS
jgi:hypothetical protein